MSIQRDSLSRCEQPSMLYDAIRNPYAYTPPKSLVDSIDRTKDTFETTQQRLNREVMERFQNTSSRLSHHSFVVVAQVGKYLFLAIMLPPYICFYGIPRWFLMTAFPQIFCFAKAEVFRVGRFFMELSKHIVDLMKGALEQVIGDALKTMKDPFKRLSIHLAEQIKKLINTFQHLVRASQSFHEFLQRASRNFLSHLYVSFKKVFLAHAFTIAKKACQLGEKIVKGVLYPLDLADRLLVLPTTSWLKPKFRALAFKGKTSLLAAQAIVKKYAQKMGEPILNTVNFSFNWALEQMKQLQLAGLKWTRPKIEKMQSSLEQMAHHVRKKFIEPLKYFREYFQGKTEEIAKQSSLAVFQQAFLYMQPMITWIWSQEPVYRVFNRFKRGVKKRGQQANKKYKGILKPAKFLLKQGKGLVKKSTLIANYCRRQMCKMWQWMIKQLLTLPYRIAALVISITIHTLRFIRKTVYGLRLFGTWVWVAFGFGMALVRELAQEMSSWFLKKNY